MIIELVPKVLVVLNEEADRLKCKAGLLGRGLEEGRDFMLFGHHEVVEDYVIPYRRQLLVFDRVVGSDMATKVFVENLLTENPRLHLLAFRDRVFDQMVITQSDPSSVFRKTVYVKPVPKNSHNSNKALVDSIEGFINPKRVTCVT